MNVQLNEGILWTAYFGYIILWFTVCQITCVWKSPKIQRFVSNILGLVPFAFILCFYFVLGLSLKYTLSIFAVFIGLNLLQLKVLAGISEDQRWKRIRILAILSWFQHSALFVVLAIALRSSIWLIGATIIFIGGILNIYFELVVKDAIKHLDPSIKAHSLLSGFVLNEEFPIVAIPTSTSFLYFPLLYFIPYLSRILGSLVEVAYSSSYLVLFLIALFGAVAGLFASTKNEQVKDLERILTRVFVGFILIALMLLGFFIVGSILKAMDYLDIVGAFSFQLNPYDNNALPPTPLLLNQLWFAGWLVLLLYYVLYSLVIIYLVRGGRSYLKKT